MAFRPRILAFAGSSRKDSYNKKLVRIAAACAAEAGAEVTFQDLADLPLPVYDGDLETAEGVPANARTLRKLMMAHQGWLIATPENNGSTSALLKNAIDWTSRKDGDDPGQVAFPGRIALLLSVSTGAGGGRKGLAHLRDILQHRTVLVLPESLSVPHAARAFGDNGALADGAQQEQLARIAARLVETVARLKGS